MIILKNIRNFRENRGTMVIIPSGLEIFHSRSLAKKTIIILRGK